MKKITLSILVLIFAFGCSKPAEQDTLAELYVRYDSDSKNLKAEATFFEFKDGKKGKPKVFPNGVQFINGGMRNLDIPNGEIRYFSEFSGSLPLTIDFTWDLAKDNPETMEVPLKKINRVSIEKNELSLQNGFAITLETSTLEKNEKLVLAITDSKGQAKNLETKGPTNTAKFKIPGSELKGLSTGEATLYVVRSSTLQADKPTSKVMVNSEFYTSSQWVKIVE